MEQENPHDYQSPVSDYEPSWWERVSGYSDPNFDPEDPDGIVDGDWGILDELFDDFTDWISGWGEFDEDSEEAEEERRQEAEQEADEWL